METLTKVSEGKRDEYETCVRLGDAPRTPSPQLRGLDGRVQLITHHVQIIQSLPVYTIGFRLKLPRHVT